MQARLFGKIQYIECTVKPVWNDPVWKDHPVWEDRFPVHENVYLPLASMQAKPFWNDHLSKDHFFLTSKVVSRYVVDNSGGRAHRQNLHLQLKITFIK